MDKRLQKSNIRHSCTAPVIPAKETVQETLARSRWRKTQPPKSPLSGGLSTQFLPDKGDFPLNSPLIRGTFHSIPP